MPKNHPIKVLPPAEYLRSRLDYNPKTGELTWKQVAKRLPHLVGKPAGSRESEYIRIAVNGSRYFAHRVIWKMMTGKDPSLGIDHKDRNGFNNRWNNLRLANQTQSLWNRKMPRQVGPYRGVQRQKKKWAAYIRVDGVHRYLGSFLTPEDAAAAYEFAARQLHGEFYSD